MTREQLRELVGIAIGEASMCWSEIPTGVFDSTKASTLVDRIMDAIPEPKDQLAKRRLEHAAKQRNEILKVVNDPGIQWKVRRALLRDKFGFAETLIDELVGKTEPVSDY